MVAKKNRLKKGEIEYTMKKGDKSNSRFFIVKHLKSTENFPKFCVIISKKINKSAVKRNKLKRQICEILRQTENSELKSSKNIILIPKKEITQSNFQEIEADLGKLTLN
ncbi:ribonuclease P protein component [Patescibacteria group bacterium]|nr:ribonuclease P protein component [Patescibacteria group bacterium]